MKPCSSFTLVAYLLLIFLSAFSEASLSTLNQTVSTALTTGSGELSADLPALPARLLPLARAEDCFKASYIGQYLPGLITFDGGE